MTKTVLFLFVFLLLATASYAQFQVSIIEYHPESRFARIQILHAGDTDYHELHFAMDREAPEKLVGLIRPQTAIVIGKLVTPGEHAVKLTTQEGTTFTETLLFAKSESLVEREQKDELEKQAQAEAALREQPSPPQAPSQAAESVADGGYSLAIGIVVLLLAILIFLFVARSAMKRKRGQKPVPRAMPGRGDFKQKVLQRRRSNL